MKATMTTTHRFLPTLMRYARSFEQTSKKKKNIGFMNPPKKSTRSYSSSQIVLSNSKRPRVHSTGASVESTWYTPKGSRSNSLEMGRYGLYRLNYATIEPPVWTVPPHPPTKTYTERLLFPLTLVITGAFVMWAYLNPEEDDMREYWKRVETGQILVEDDDEDDEGEDWDDEDD